MMTNSKDVNPSSTKRCQCSGCCCKACMPYHDAYMVAAQLMSIVAFCVSWLWYVTLILGAVAMILLQTIWCCRLSRCGLIWSSIIAFLTSLSCITAGVLMIMFWYDNPYCSVFFLKLDDDLYGYGNYDSCNEVAWVVGSFATGVLWAAVGACVRHFVVSGRFARCEEEHVSAQVAAQMHSATIELSALECNGIIPVTAVAIPV